MTFELEEKPEYRTRKVEMADDVWEEVEAFAEFVGEKYGKDVSVGQAVASLIKTELTETRRGVRKEFWEWKEQKIMGEQEQPELEEEAEDSGQEEEVAGERESEESDKLGGDVDETGEIDVPVESEEEDGEQQRRRVER